MSPPDAWERPWRSFFRSSDVALLALAVLTVGVTLNSSRGRHMRPREPRPRRVEAIRLEQSIARAHADRLAGRLIAGAAFHYPASSTVRAEVERSLRTMERSMLAAEDAVTAADAAFYRLPSVDTALITADMALWKARREFRLAMLAANDTERRGGAGWPHPGAGHTVSVGAPPAAPAWTCGPAAPPPPGRGALRCGNTPRDRWSLPRWMR